VRKILHGRPRVLSLTRDLFAVANLYYWLSLSLFHPVVGRRYYLLFCYYFAIFVIVVNENITVFVVWLYSGNVFGGKFCEVFFARAGISKVSIDCMKRRCCVYRIRKKLNKNHYFAVIGLYFSHQRLMVRQRSEVNVDGVLSSLCRQI